MDLTATINILELLVFLSALLGLLVTLTLIPGVVYTLLLVLRRRIDGIVRRTSYSDLREESGRAWRLFGYTFMSGVSMTLPPAVRSDTRNLTSVVLLLALSWVVIDTVYSLMAWWDRVRNLRDAARERKEKRAAEGQSEGSWEVGLYLPAIEGENGPQDGAQAHTGRIESEVPNGD